MVPNRSTRGSFSESTKQTSTQPSGTTSNATSSVGERPRVTRGKLFNADCQNNLHIQVENYRTSPGTSEMRGKAFRFKRDEPRLIARSRRPRAPGTPTSTSSSRCRVLDGARLWHASAKTRISEAEYSAHFDTVSVCFSKALGAPIGSCLAGPRAFVNRARRFKQQFGGGFRQAGIIAAGALYALDHHRSRLGETHDMTRRMPAANSGLSRPESDASYARRRTVTRAEINRSSGHRASGGQEQHTAQRR